MTLRGRSFTPTIRFSSTVSERKMSLVCGTRPMPRRARSELLSDDTSAPPIRISPP
jgi:hypothetical protein